MNEVGLVVFVIRFIQTQEESPMKAAFTLTPAESKRLIAKAVVQMDEVKQAMRKAYVIVLPGTTGAFVAQELLGASRPEPRRYAVGVNSHRLLCVTDPANREPLPIILYEGKPCSKTIDEALKDFHRETVVIKGANAVDPEGNAGIIMAGFDGGTMAKTVGTVVSQGLRYIVPVGLEKTVRSVKEAAAWTGAKTLDYSIGADFGMMPMPNAVVVTETQALKILAGVEARHIASGGIGESVGSVVLIVQGSEEGVRKAISLVESIKGEPPIQGSKGVCETCRYACCFSGRKIEALPEWLQD
jgi:hypothetical protein